MHVCNIHTVSAARIWFAFFSLCISAPSMVSGILLALDNCLLNGIKKKIDVGDQRKWGIAKYWSWLVLGLGRQATKILPCPLLVGIGKKSMSGPEDDFWFWADASIHWSSWWARLENPMARIDLISEVWKIPSHVNSGQSIKVAF